MSRSRYGTSLYGAFVTAPAPGPGDEPRCSAHGCGSAADVDLRWRNPRLHDASRVKHWVACPAQADQLADFLARRGFLLGRGPLATRDPLER